MKKLLALIIVALMLTMMLASCDLSWLPIETPTPESHKCESICPECGKCVDAECVEDACKDKCEGHEPPACEHVYDNACDADCNVCGAKREVGEHAYDNACDADCNVCGAEREVGEHAYDNACDADCNVCGAEREVGEHTYDNACDADCNVCGAEREVGEHTYDNACDADCNVCGAEREVAEHQYDEVVTAPTCFAAGYTTHTCTECGKNYTDTPTAQLTHVDADGDEKCDHGCGTDMPKPRYEVSFNTDGAGNVEPQTIKEGETATAPADPQKTGYTFLGWYMGNAKYDFATPITANIALVAKWQANTYTLTFGESKLTVTYGQAVGELPAVPSVEGKKDGKWMLDGAELTAETVYNFTEDKEATAKYEDITFTVTFKDGETDRGTFTFKYGTVMVPPALSGVNNNQYMYWAVDGQPYSFSEPVKSDLTIEVVRKSLVAPHYDVEVGGGQLVMDLALLGDNAWFGEVASVRAHGVEAEFTVDGSKLSISEDALLVGENAIIITNKDGALYRFLAVKATMFIDEVADFANMLTHPLLNSGTVADETKAAYYIIVKDLDLSGYTGIGKYDGNWQNVFYGTLDGRGHVLSNFVGSQQKGFIACVAGTIKNITFVNADNTGRGGVLSSQLLAGAVIDNVHVTGKISTDGAGWGASTLFVGNINAGVKIKNSSVTCTGLPATTTNTALLGKLNGNDAEFVNCKVYVSEALSSANALLINGKTYKGTVEKIVMAEVNVDYNYDFEVTTEGNATYTVDLSKITEENAKYAWGGNILKVTLDGLALDYTLDGTTIAINEASLAMGENKIRIESDNYKTYVITVVKATMLIDEAADFAKMITKPLYNVNDPATAEQKNAYYVITKDIDLTGYTGLGAYSGGWTNVFYGTLDGRGHTLSNFVGSQQKGFIACIGGTVKNIKFVNAGNTGRGGVLCSQLLAGAVIDNVDISGKITGDGAVWGQSSMFGLVNAGVSIKNCDVTCTALPATTTYTAIFCTVTANGVAFENCTVSVPATLSTATVVGMNRGGSFTYTGTITVNTIE